jgi:hypothetical protein
MHCFGGGFIIRTSTEDFWVGHSKHAFDDYSFQVEGAIRY